MRQLGATEPAQYLPVRGVAVVHHDVIVGALLVGLQLELGEPQLDPVAGSRGEYPDTLLTMRAGFKKNLKKKRKKSQKRISLQVRTGEPPFMD